MTRNFSPPKYPSLVALAHKCVLNAPNGLDAYDIAPLAGYEGRSGYATMMAELTQPDRKCDMDRLLPIMDATGSDAPVEFLARHRGGVFIRVPEPAQSNAELVQALAASIKEFGEFAAEAASGIADGRVARDELDRILKEGQESMEAIMAMMKLARVTHEAQYGPYGGRP